MGAGHCQLWERMEYTSRQYFFFDSLWLPDNINTKCNVTTVLDEAKCSEVLRGQTSHINLWEEKNATCSIQICKQHKHVSVDLFTTNYCTTVNNLFMYVTADGNIVQTSINQQYTKVFATNYTVAELTWPNSTNTTEQKLDLWKVTKHYLNSIITVL